MPLITEVFYSETYDPFINLAIEDWIFSRIDEKRRSLYLWRNRDAVVLGRFQNPWTECRLREAEKNNVVLVRRQSGGGTVFHDLGNTNFTFLSPRDEYSKERNIAIVTGALNELDLPARVNARNDIIVDGKKVSGSAYKLTGSKAFHHGTLLVNSDLDRLQYYLTPEEKDVGELTTKGIGSVRSQVVNLCRYRPSLTHETLCEAIVNYFLRYHGAEADVRRITREEALSIPHIREAYARYCDWQWIIGRTPRFIQRLEKDFAWGTINMEITCNKGIVCEVRVGGQCPDIGFKDALAAAVLGHRYDRVATEVALLARTADSLPASTVQNRNNPIWEQWLKDIADWLRDRM
jgi:lipoate-protein ligase A